MGPNQDRRLQEEMNALRYGKHRHRGHTQEVNDNVPLSDRAIAA